MCQNCEKKQRLQKKQLVAKKKTPKQQHKTQC